MQSPYGEYWKRSLINQRQWYQQCQWYQQYNGYHQYPMYQPNNFEIGQRIKPRHKKTVTDNVIERWELYWQQLNKPPGLYVEYKLWG